jgi:eukaryotic-like serine/threonine-protein kinase
VAEAPVTIGAIFAGYRIERKLGEGGMGAVYLAASTDLPRQDAIKVLSVELSRNPEFRARFTREADVAARLSHPNIVAVYRRGETPTGQLWIAMQYVEGPDADAALRAEAMTPQRAVAIIGQIASALDYAHQRHVVHRDIKPANFLLHSDGHEERALLADFGIARALDDAGLTASGTVLSTVAYVAPEVLAGLPIDYRADIYSLGCALFKLLTGKTPFWTATGAPAVMLAHLQQPPPRVTDLAPGLPPELDEVIAVAMAKDPAQRFKSAGEFAAAANLALRGESQTVRRHIRAAAAGATPTLAPVLHGTGPVSFDSSHRTHRKRRVLAALFGVAFLTAGAVTAVTISRQHPRVAAPPPATLPVAPVPMQALLALLPTTDELTAALGAAGTLDAPTTGIGVDSQFLDSQDCAGPWMAGQRAAYFGSGWQALELQSGSSRRDPGRTSPGSSARSIVAVLSFPLAELASRFLDSQRAVWENCAGKKVTFTGADNEAMPERFTAFTVAADNIFSISFEGSYGILSCGRGLTVRNNVSIDVAVCDSPQPIDDAVSLTRRIAAKVPH